MNLEIVLEGAKNAARLAAEYIHSQIGLVADKQIIEKDFNSLVSYVDQTAEKIIVEELAPLISNAGFLTEEDTVDRVESEYVWVIDPLDGTTNFY